MTNAAVAAIQSATNVSFAQRGTCGGNSFTYAAVAPTRRPRPRGGQQASGRARPAGRERTFRRGAARTLSPRGRRSLGEGARRPSCR
jgi:hypothetical protein